MRSQLSIMIHIFSRLVLRVFLWLPGPWLKFCFLSKKKNIEDKKRFRKKLSLCNIWVSCQLHLKFDGKCLKTHLTLCFAEDAVKTLFSTSSPLRGRRQEPRHACVLYMSRNPTAASCQRRRFVSSLILEANVTYRFNLQSVFFLLHNVELL